MKLSNEGIDFLTGFEKVRYSAYRDNKGFSTGIGHYIKPDEPWLLKATLTHAQVLWLFKKDCFTLEKELNRLLDKYGIKLEQRQYDALFSLYYNCGMTKVLKTPLFFHLKGGNKDQIINSWMLLDKAIESIRLRRASELALFFG